MLMGLQQRACSRRNQLPAPVDVFLIRLLTLHRAGWLQDMALGLSLGQRQETLNPPAQGLCTLCTPSARDPCTAQPVPPTFQLPAQALSPCSACASVPNLLKGTSSPWGQAGAVWAAPGLAKCILQVEASHSPLPVCFQRRQKGERP